MVSILLGVWNGGGECCCCPAQCSGMARAPLVPLQYWRVLQCVSCTVLCQVGGVWVVSVCLWCSCGGVSSVRSPPRRGWWVGLSWMVGGMVSEGRSRCWPPRLVCGVPPSICVVVLLNGGSGGLCVVPVFGLGPPLHVVLSLFVLSFSLFFFVCCYVCCGWGSAVVGAVLLSCRCGCAV